MRLPELKTTGGSSLGGAPQYCEIFTSRSSIDQVPTENIGGKKKNPLRFPVGEAKKKDSELSLSTLFLARLVLGKLS